jgi:hypothetical protein
MVEKSALENVCIERSHCVVATNGQHVPPESLTTLTGCCASVCAWRSDCFMSTSRVLCVMSDIDKDNFGYDASTETA